MQENQKIENVLQSGRTLKSAEPNPYLFSKIMERMKDKASEAYQTHPTLVWISMSVLTLFIAINIYVLSTGDANSTSNEMNEVANAYGLNNQGGLNYE